MPRTLKPPLRTEPERDALALENLRLVWHIAGRLYESSPEVRALGYDDAAGYGFLGLLRAAELFDPAAGKKFSTFAWPAITRRILHAARHENSLIHVPDHVRDGSARRRGSPRAAEMEEAAERAGAVRYLTEDGGAFDPPAPAPPEPEGDAEGIPALVAAACLTGRQQRALELRYGTGWTLARCAREMGVSKARVGQLTRAAVEKLREVTGEEPQPSKSTKYRRELQRELEAGRKSANRNLP